MNAENVKVLGLGLWLPRHPDVLAWTSGRANEDAIKPEGRALDRINRRRAGVLGRAIADAAAQALTEAEVDASTTPSVIGSAIGEVAAMISLLEQMWRTREPVSPATFTVSVHSATSGLLSISTKNQGYTTSLAADENTPAMALLEAIALIHDTGAPVLVACGDEDSPRDLAADMPPWDLLAAALVLAPLRHPRPGRAFLSVEHGSPATLPAAALPDPLARNPQAGLVDLVDAIHRGREGRVALDHGTGRGYVASLQFERVHGTSE